MINEYIHHACNLMPLEEDYYFKDWSSFGEPILNVPPLLGTETDALVPLPETLCEFDELSSFPSPFPTSDGSAALVPYNPYHASALQLNGFPSDDAELDLDLEFLTWSDDLLQASNETVMSNPLPLNISGKCHPDHCSSSIVASNCELVPYDEVIELSTGDSARIWADEKKRLERRGSGRSSRLNNISFDEIKKYFYMPITLAAKEMNVGLTVLKKRCRELGISRWPHRKMKSLKSLIHNVQELGQGASATTEDSIRNELERLEEYKKMMEVNPEMQLTERTKRLRQACFKANYKKRRLLQYPDLQDNKYYPFIN